MKKFEIKKETIEIHSPSNCISESNILSAMHELDERFPEEVFSADTLDAAKEFLASTEPSTTQRTTYNFDCDIFYIEENDYDDDGEWTSGGDIHSVKVAELYPININAFPSNIELSAAEGRQHLTIQLGGDDLAVYSDTSIYSDVDEAIADAESDFRTEIESAFPNSHSEIVEDALRTVMIYAEPTICSAWN
jgi:hypothetical protein